MAGATSTLSQNTSDTGEPGWFENTREVKYRELNEFAKYVEYKKKAERKDSLQQAEIESLQQVIERQQNVIEIYEKETIPTMFKKLEAERNKFDAQVGISASIEREWEAKYKRLKRRRWSLGLGATGGYGTSLTGTGISGVSPSATIGITLNYTILRF